MPDVPSTIAGVLSGYLPTTSPQPENCGPSSQYCSSGGVPSTLNCLGSLNGVLGQQNESAALCALCGLTSRICAADQCVPNRARVIAVSLFQRALMGCMLMRCVGGLEMTRMLRPAAILVLLALLSSSGCASSSWHLRKESDSQYYERFWRRGNFGPRDTGGGWVMNPLYNPLYN